MKHRTRLPRAKAGRRRGRTRLFVLSAALQLNLNNIGDTKYADKAYDRHFMPGPSRQILFSPVFSF